MSKLWLIVILVRGETDGRVPYGFVLPELGGAAIALTTLGLLGLLAAQVRTGRRRRARLRASRLPGLLGGRTETMR